MQARARPLSSCWSIRTAAQFSRGEGDGEEDGEGTGSWKVVAIEGLAETVIVGAWTRGEV